MDYSALPKRRLQNSFVPGVIAFRLTLDLAYVLYLDSTFADHFLTPLALNFELDNYLISILPVVLFAAVTPRSMDDFKGVFFWITGIFFLLPISSIYGLDATRSPEGFSIAVYAVFLSILLSGTSPSTISLPGIRNGTSISLVFSSLMILAFIGWTVASGAVNGISFDLGQIYNLRADAGEVLDVGILAYLNIWTQKVFAPFILIVGLVRRSRFITLSIVLLHLYFFGVTQHRIHLFTPVLIFIVYWIYRIKPTANFLYIASSAGLLLLLVAATTLEVDEIGAIAIRRAFFVAASATYDWIEYFSQNPFVFFSDRLLADILPSSYNGVFLPALLGDEKKFGFDIMFNVGLVGSGYAQAGWPGVTIYVLIISIILKALNGLIKNGVEPAIVASLMAVPIRVAWADSDLLTTLVSHGVIVGFLILWLYGKSNMQSVAIRSRSHSQRSGFYRGHDQLS